MDRPRQSAARPSPATAISLVALFVALGGTGYAVQRNSVGSKELQKDAVKGRHVDERKLKGRHIKPEKLKGRHVKDGTLTGDEVKNFSLTGADVFPHTIGGEHIVDDSLTGADVDESSLGRVPDARKVGGVELVQIQAEVAPGDPAATLFEVGGMTVEFSCGTIASPNDSNLLLDFAVAPTTTYRLAVWPTSDENSDLLVSGERDRSGGASGTGGKEWASLVAASGGESATAQLQLFNAAGGQGCLVSGMALRG